jgi:diacylglycerol O-acyltransferase / wax synthase
MEPVSPTSASLLRLESPAAQLHAGWLARLEAHGPRELDVAGLQARIEKRLLAVPRLRAALAPGDAAGGELVWREDPDFAIDRHVVAWDREAGEEEVRVIVERFLDEPLARERPLWRVLAIPRTRAGGPLVAAKLHRALADGQDADLLRGLVFDTPWGEQTAPPAAPADAALEELRAMRAQRDRAGDTGAPGRIGATLRRAAFARSEGLVAAPPSFLDGPAGGRRTLVTARAELGRLTRIAQRTQTTLHGVVLAVLAGTLRRLALARGESPADLRALVPLRIDGAELLGETPCAVVSLPVAERSPARRLAAVHAAVEAATRGEEQPPTGMPPPTLIAGPPEELAARLAIGVRVSNLTIPSAAGPARRLRLDGVRVRALFPLTALPEDHAIALGTLSYDRHLHVAAAADTAVLGAIGRLPIMLADALEELAVSTGAGRPALAGPHRFPVA